MDRRSFLPAVGVALSPLVAGCSSEEDSREPNEDCELIHEMEEPSEEHGEPVETYKYENLSKVAQQVFDEARQNGVYFTKNQSLRTEEFQYQGISSYYNITYQNETYLMSTYVNEGCYGP